MNVRADKITEAIFTSSIPIMAVVIGYLSTGIYTGCVLLKVCPTVQALGWS
jgi:hypothetical protein